jgi:hypothetical protein
LGEIVCKNGGEQSRTTFGEIMTQGDQEPQGWDTPRKGEDASYPQPPAQPQSPGQSQSPGQPQYGQPNQGLPSYGQQPYGRPSYQQPVGQQPGYPQQFANPAQDPTFVAARKSPMVLGILGTVFGAISIFVFPFIIGAAGLVLSIVGMPQVMKLRRNFPGHPTGGVLSLVIVGLVLSIIGILGGILVQGLRASM